MTDALPAGVFHGTVSARRQLQGITLVETHYRDKVQIPPHWHERAYFCFVVQGAYVEQSGAHTHTCESSTLLFHPAGEKHADWFLSDKGTCFNIEVDRGHLEARYGHIALPEEPITFQNKEVNGFARQLHTEFCRGASASDLVYEGLALALFGASIREARSTTLHRLPPSWYGKVLDLLQARFREKLDLATIAAAVGVHPVHLARGFRRYQGCTVGAYVRKLRIEHACHQLRTSEESLAAIALAVGFVDQSHFSRTFKQHMGITPATYRRLHIRC